MTGSHKPFRTDNTTEAERSELALEAAGVCTWELDPVHNRVWMSHRCKALFGLAGDSQVPYDEVLSLIYADDRGKVHGSVQRALHDQSSGQYVIQFRLAEAEGAPFRWLRSKGKAYFNAEGVAQRLLGIVEETELRLDRQPSTVSETMAELALENSSSGYFYVTLATDEMHYSPGFARIWTGDPHKTIARTDFISYIHPEDLPIRERAYELATRTGKLDYEIRIIWNDETIHWMRARGTYLRDSAGKPYLLTGTIRETTAEHLHKEAEDLLGAAFNRASIGMAFTDANHQLLRVNSAFANLFGYSEEELYAVNYQNLIHPDDQAQNARLLDEVVTGKRSHFNLTNRYVRRDGEIRWMQINVTVIAGSTDKEGRILTLARDINPEVENEKALAASEALFKNVSNSAPTGLWLSDEQGQLIYLNKQLAEWTSRSSELLLGTGWINTLLEDDQQRSLDAFKTAVAARAHYDVLFRIKKSNGQVIWCRAAGDPYYREDGSYAGYVGYCMDIDELMAGREALQQSEARFRSIVEQAPMAIGLLKGEEMRIEVGNDKLFDMWGKTPAITGMRLAEGLPELQDQPFIDLLREVYATGRPYVGNGVLVKLERDGKPEDVYFDLVYTPLRDASGTVTGVLVMATEVTQQVLYRKALEAGEAKLRSVIATAPAAMGLFVGRDLIVEMPNQTFIDIVGKGSDIAGKPLREVMPELDNQAFLQILDEVYTSGQMFQTYGTQVNIVKQGVMTHNFYNITYSPLFDAEGKVYAILDIAIDVTEAVKAQQKLEESELFSRSIIDHSPVAKVVFVGENMTIERVNQNMLAMLGRDESILGLPFMDAIPELRSTPLMDRLSHVFSTGETYYQPEEKIELLKQGQVYTGYYNYIYKALRNTNGVVYGVIVTATEVTSLVQARQHIAEAEESLRGAVELAELGTWTVDPLARTLTYDDRMKHWLGLTGDGLQFEDALVPVVENDRVRVLQALQTTLQPQSRGTYDQEYLIENSQTGQRRIIHAQAKAFFDSQGLAYRLVGTAQDITEQRHIQLALEREVQKRTEELEATNEELAAINEEVATANEELATTNEELAESNQLLMRSNQNLEQFAYVASHDLQEPLRKIQSFGDILKAQYAEGLGEGTNYLERMQIAANRMSVLIKDLLAYSRISTQKDLTAAVSLTEVVNTVLNNLDLTIHETGAVVEVDPLPTVPGDQSQLGQLFQNLLSNALKFRKPTGNPRIEVRVEKVTALDLPPSVRPARGSAAYYRIDVSDNGIGFDEKYVDRIFQVFQRLHGKSQYAGTGIGLAICEKVASNHGGAITATSQPGQGATFSVYLPVLL